MAMNWDRVWNDGRMIIDGDRDHFLSVRMYYSLGTCHMRRGYYLSVTPVRRVDRGGYAMLEMCPSDGKSVLVKSVTRRSAKADAEASRIADGILNMVVSEVCSKNGIDRLDVGGLISD